MKKSEVSPPSGSSKPGGGPSGAAVRDDSSARGSIGESRSSRSEKTDPSRAKPAREEEKQGELKGASKGGGKSQPTKSRWDGKNTRLVENLTDTLARKSGAIDALVERLDDSQAEIIKLRTERDTAVVQVKDVV